MMFRRACLYCTRNLVTIVSQTPQRKSAKALSTHAGVSFTSRNIRAAVPASEAAFSVPLTNGFADRRCSGGTTSHNISSEELLTVNLNVRSENLPNPALH